MNRQIGNDQRQFGPRQGQHKLHNSPATTAFVQPSSFLWDLQNAKETKSETQIGRVSHTKMIEISPSRFGFFAGLAFFRLDSATLNYSV